MEADRCCCLAADRAALAASRAGAAAPERERGSEGASVGGWHEGRVGGRGSRDG